MHVGRDAAAVARARRDAIEVASTQSEPESESRKEKRPRAGSGGGWGLFALCGGHSVASQQTSAVSPLSLCRHLDIHTVYPAVCSEARLAAGTKVLIARGGEGAGTPFGWRADSQRKIPSRAVPKKGKRRQSRSKAKQKQKKHSQRTMGEAGGREQKGEAATSGERRRLGSVCAVRWAQRDITADYRRFPSLSLQTPRYTYCISRSLL